METKFAYFKSEMVKLSCLTSSSVEAVSRNWDQKPSSEHRHADHNCHASL